MMSRYFLYTILIIGFSISNVIAQDYKTEIIKTFRSYIELNEDFKYSVEHGKGRTGKSSSDLRKEVEHYGENDYTNSLDMAKEVICKNKDSELISELYQVLISTRNSADEYPSFVLAEIYICNPSLIESEFIKLRRNDQEIIYDNLAWGFKNVTYNKADTISNYKALDEKLKQLKP